MAAAGFVCIDEDSAQCFMCKKCLDGWEPQDDPWMEHQHHSPQCPLFGRSIDHLDELNVEEVMDLQLEQFMFIMNKVKDNGVKCLQQLYQRKMKELDELKSKACKTKVQKLEKLEKSTKETSKSKKTPAFYYEDFESMKENLDGYCIVAVAEYNSKAKYYEENILTDVLNRELATSAREKILQWKRMIPPEILHLPYKSLIAVDFNMNELLSSQMEDSHLATPEMQKTVKKKPRKKVTKTDTVTKTLKTVKRSRVSIRSSTQRQSKSKVDLHKLKFNPARPITTSTPGARRARPGEAVTEIVLHHYVSARGSPIVEVEERDSFTS